MERYKESELQVQHIPITTFQKGQAMILDALESLNPESSDILFGQIAYAKVPFAEGVVELLALVSQDYIEIQNKVTQLEPEDMIGLIFLMAEFVEEATWLGNVIEQEYGINIRNEKWFDYGFILRFIGQEWVKFVEN